MLKDQFFYLVTAFPLGYFCDLSTRKHPIGSVTKTKIFIMQFKSLFRSYFNICYRYTYCGFWNFNHFFPVNFEALR